MATRLWPFEVSGWTDLGLAVSRFQPVDSGGLTEGQERKEIKISGGDFSPPRLNWTNFLQRSKKEKVKTTLVVLQSKWKGLLGYV